MTDADADRWRTDSKPRSTPNSLPYERLRNSGRQALPR